jgi:hypothetical protein
LHLLLKLLNGQSALKAGEVQVRTTLGKGQRDTGFSRSLRHRHATSAVGVARWLLDVDGCARRIPTRLIASIFILPITIDVFGKAKHVLENRKGFFSH